MENELIRVPMLDMLQKHRYKKSISMHVPGHKNGVVLPTEAPQSFSSALSWDVTELTGLDDLHEPEEGIKEAEALLTAFYQTKKSYFLVNGSTVGNLAMILASIQPGDKVLVQRNCHKSVMNGLKLAKANPIFLTPVIETGISISVPYETIFNSLNEHPDVKAIIITYPNYYGLGFDLAPIIKEAHKKGILVLVDEAHGAHFAAGAPFPPSSVSLGADIVVHSAHKTLPAMTMGSYLHINSESVNQQRVEEYLRMLQSSSPSYPIMLSLDLARAYLESYSEKDKEYLSVQIDSFKQYIWKHEELGVFEPENSDIQDPLKLILYHKRGLSGYELQKLMEEAGIYPELADERYVLLILPLLKESQPYSFEEIIQRFETIKWVLGDKAQTSSASNPIVNEQKHKESVLAISYEEMDIRSRKKISLALACGEISAETIVPYPPGVPLIQKGEVITLDMVQKCISLLTQGAKIQGGVYLKQQQIEVFA